MAKSKGGCLGVVIMVGTFIALCCMCIPLFKTFTTDGIDTFCLTGGIVAVIALIACAIMGVVYKKPEFEDETIGHAFKRWLFGALGAAALGAAFFFFIGPSQLKSAAVDAKKDVPKEAHESARTASEAK